jgi:hypothetical protein
MLIFCGGVMTCFALSLSFVESPAFPFIGLREDRDAGGALEVKFCRALWKHCSDVL